MPRMRGHGPRDARHRRRLSGRGIGRKRWLTQEELIEDWAVARTLPGPNVVKLSPMVGGR